MSDHHAADTAADANTAVRGNAAVGAIDTGTNSGTNTGAHARATVRLLLNGSPCEATCEARTHLADHLREHHGLTGTHLGCEHGVCGACTIEVNGQPVRSCLTLAVTCEGAQVSTIEGLQDDAVMQALMQAFSAEHALQCGYCTPGMLVTARDIVQRLPDADAARIRLELSGNLCRCTGYRGIVRAIERVLADRRGHRGQGGAGDAA